MIYFFNQFSFFSHFSLALKEITSAQPSISKLQPSIYSFTSSINHPSKSSSSLASSTNHPAIIHHQSNHSLNRSLLIHQSNRSPTHSFIHSPVQPITLLFIYSFTSPTNHSSSPTTRPSIHLFTYQFNQIHLFIHQSNQSHYYYYYSIINQSNQSTIHSLIYSQTSHLSIHFIHSPVKSIIHQFTS